MTFVTKKQWRERARAAEGSLTRKALTEYREVLNDTSNAVTVRDLTRVLTDLRTIYPAIGQEVPSWHLHPGTILAKLRTDDIATAATALRHSQAQERGAELLAEFQFDEDSFDAGMEAADEVREEVSK